MAIIFSLSSLLLFVFLVLPTTNQVQKIAAQKEPFWAKRWLRISEIVDDMSSGDASQAAASLVYITMPFPRTWMKSRDWLGWCEMLTAHGRPTVLIRGNGANVMTDLSE